MQKFLNEGHKVKVTIMFRGRELGHPELGRRILDRLAEELDGSASIETEARLDGRNMVMVLAPDKRAKQSQAAGSKKSPTAEQAATNGQAETNPEERMPNGQTEEPKAEAQVEIDPVSVTDTETEDAIGDDGPES